MSFRHPQLRAPIIAFSLSLAVACSAMGCSDPLTDDGQDAQRSGASDGGQDSSALFDGSASLDARPHLDGSFMDRSDMALTACSASDTDGDGFGTHESCARVDCDEGNPSIHPDSFEACNGQDDDCDLQIDEDLGDSVCGVGMCMVSTENCSDGQTIACAPDEPTAEVCNSMDDDCDGQTDEEVDAVRCGVGACERSAQCVGGQLGECVPGDPVRELCNGADDDCDGVVDNGFRARIVPSTYTDLVNHHAACDGSGQRIGSECNAAMSRFCRAQECGTTGFGPAENHGDNAYVTCVSGVEPHVVPFDVLWRHHEGCESPDEAISGPCNAAIHRYCSGRGQLTGFGPVELGPEDMQVVCLAEAVEVIETRYSILTQQHGPCNGTDQHIGPDCNAAIKRWCISRGFVSGFGPLEHNGDVLFVACLRP